MARTYVGTLAERPVDAGAEEVLLQLPALLWLATERLALDTESLLRLLMLWVLVVWGVR